MTLAAYFQQPSAVFESYDIRARELQWPVPAKLELYDHSAQAFGSEPDQAAFSEIYGSLRRYWQVFRGPKGNHGHWSEQECWRFLTSQTAQAVGRQRLDLEMQWHDGIQINVLAVLAEMKSIKRNREYPWMAVSKFLHFFNPSAFPIYDTAEVWNRVFLEAGFIVDYREFCETNYAPGLGDGLEFNLGYSLWASSLIRSAPKSFMPTFIDWIAGHAPQSKSLEARHLYGTAFEFASIGAARLEIESR